jgi:GTP-binding nuclear protein Ran
MSTREFKIVLVGEGGVGKTTYLKRLLTGKFEKRYIATLGVEVYPLSFNTTSRKVQLNIWDCAGQEQFNGLRDGYYRNADGAIIMADDRKLSVKNVNRDVRDICRMATSPNVPIVLVLNKNDIKEHKPRNLMSDGPSFELYTIAISAKTNYNDREPILKLLRQMMDSPDLEIMENDWVEPPVAIIS